MGNAHELAEIASSMQPQALEDTQHADVQGNQLNEYKVPRYTPDKYSQEIQLRNAIRERSSQMGGQLTVPVTDKEVAFLKRLTEQTQRAEYNRFIETAFDRSDPANRALFLKMFPEFARIREQLIENEAEIQTKIAKLKITGIQSEEDAKFVWALNQGTIVLPDKPLFDPTGALSKFEVYQNGPFAPPISVRKSHNLDALNRELGFTKAAEGRRGLTDTELMIGRNSVGELAHQVATAMYQPS